MQTDPRPGIASLFDTVAAEYDQSGVPFFSVFGRWLVEAAQPQPGERVLDVGAGRGAATLPAAEAVGLSGHVDAIDLSRGMVAELQRTVAERRLANVGVRQGDLQDLEVEPASYDVVVAALVLFFLPDPAQGLRHLHRALRPGGRLVMSTFGQGDPNWRWLKDLALMIPEERRPPVRLPGTDRDPFRSDESLARLLEQSGFSTVTSELREHTAPFTDVAVWKRWSMATGQRTLLLNIPNERQADADALIDARTSELRERAGGIILRTQLRITTAYA